jgi:osmotically-inducible protein OsmY
MNLPRRVNAAVVGLRQEKKQMKRDSEIQQAVIRELRWDTRVDETDVGVEVDASVVTLTGTVDSYLKRMAAQDAAHRVFGVLDVANDIRVHIPGQQGRTDTEIAQAVRRALEWHTEVPHERIRTSVSAGRVTLEGSVDHWYERENAELAVRHLSGVHGVDNQILVTPSTIASGIVRSEIEEALERRADRAAKHIGVSVDDGRVVLTGTVRSWPEKRAVLGAARFTTGVRDVVDHLQIVPER